MRTLPLTALFALSLSGTAYAEWPSGARATYMDECLATARQTVESAEAEKHCACGADVIGKNFSTEEIRQLNDRQTPPPVELRERLYTGLAACRSEAP